MRLIVRSAISLALLFLGGPLPVCAQDTINIADLVLAVRKGLVEAQRREAQSGLVPMFLVKDFEMTITFVVEKSGTAGISLKVVELGGNIKKEETHTVTIRSETAALEHVKSRLTKCLGQSPTRTYATCFDQAYKELGLTSTTGIHR